MVLDTTAANAGHLTLGFIFIQQILGKTLFWCACQKQVGKLIICEDRNDLEVENMKKQKYYTFLHFRQKFCRLKTDKTMYIFIYIHNDFLYDYAKKIFTCFRKIKKVHV